MAKSCCVCSDSKETPDNRLFRCGGQGCGIIVHQACYGIVTVPTGFWFCRKCESQERAARVKCELCPRKDGALKRTDTGSWAHIVCALYIPEVTFGNLRTMEPIVTTKLPKERFTKVCYICEELGQENQASTGACMSCHKSNCRLAFHVTCAQKEQLLVEEEDPRDVRNIIYCGYCSTHYKRMLKQKMKQQNVRKQQVGGAPQGAGTSQTIGVMENIPTTTNLVQQTNLYGLNDINTLQDPSITFSSNPSTLPLPSNPPPPPPPPLSTSSNKPKTKDHDANRVFKRTSSDTAMSSSSGKRKYRRRKLSSSNESSTSEALSSTNETGISQSLRSISPLTALAAGSPSNAIGAGLHKKPSPDDNTSNEKQATTTNEMMDCGNLDLLASVTQNVDQVNRISNMEPVVGVQRSDEHSVLSPFPSLSVSSSIKTSTTTSTASTTTTTSEGRAETSSKDNSNSKRGNNVGKSGNVAGRKRKSTSSSSSNQRPVTNDSGHSGPPLSLHELLERQWEQTAQFILDQAGRQNNGVMLAHLHELQSENRAMQARIMELASQREFFIATNARLRQTLNEGGINKVINGIQLLSSDGGRSLLSEQEHVNGESNYSQQHHHHHHQSLEMEHTVTVGAGTNGNHWHLTNSSDQQKHHYHHHILQDGVLEQYPRRTLSTNQFASSCSSTVPLSSYALSSTVVHNDTAPVSRYGFPLPHDVTHVTNTVQGPIVAYTGFPGGMVRVTSPSQRS